MIISNIQARDNYVVSVNRISKMRVPNPEKNMYRCHKTCVIVQLSRYILYDLHILEGSMEGINININQTIYTN